MTPSDSQTPERRGHRKVFLLAALAIAVGGATVGVVSLWNPDRGPKLLNESTKAREVRPFSTAPDPRFDPLPHEKEKHGK
jgi:hypothetical protein